jgi:hypothetical protein
VLTEEAAAGERWDATHPAEPPRPFRVDLTGLTVSTRREHQPPTYTVDWSAQP